MSRSGYTDDLNDWSLIMWRGAVASAIRGGRGQQFLAEMLKALDALPEPKLVANALEESGQVCAMGAVGKSRGINMSVIDAEDRETVAATFGIAGALAAEIAFQNDEGSWRESPEQRFARMQAWVQRKITAPLPEPPK